jgi:hypothetical protein
MLAHVKESVENLLGSLGATMTPAQRRRQLLLEAQARPAVYVALCNVFSAAQRM